MSDNSNVKSYEATADTQNITLQVSAHHDRSTGNTEAPPPYGSGSAQPPSYQDVESNAPPPTYDSLYGRAKAMSQESSGAVDFVKKVLLVIFGTVGFTIFLGISLAIPIAMVAMGASHLDDCPAERYIPIYLVVAGSFAIVRNLFSIIRRCCTKKEEEDEETKPRPNPLESVIDCFMFAWFIAGNVWVYRTKGDFSSNPQASNYCDSTLYWFAFWMITIVYIFVAAGCCCCCFCGCFAIMMGGCGKNKNKE